MVAVQFGCDTQLDEYDIAEAYTHSATDEAWHWLKPESIAHRARNSCKLQVELAVQYAVMIYADTSFEADTSLSSTTSYHWLDSVPEICQVKLTAAKNHFD